MCPKNRFSTVWFCIYKQLMWYTDKNITWMASLLSVCLFTAVAFKNFVEKIKPAKRLNFSEYIPSLHDPLFSIEWYTWDMTLLEVQRKSVKSRIECNFCGIKLHGGFIEVLGVIFLPVNYISITCIGFWLYLHNCKSIQI